MVLKVMFADVQVLLAAAAVLTSLRHLIHKASAKVAPRNVVNAMAAAIPRLLTWLFVLLSLSRAVSLVFNYSAPMNIYTALPTVNLFCLRRPIQIPILINYPSLHPPVSIFLLHRAMICMMCESRINLLAFSEKLFVYIVLWNQDSLVCPTLWEGSC